MITERIYIRTEGLGELHEQAARLEEAGWKKASGVMYTHDQEGSGWEMAMYREFDEDDPPLDSFVKLFNGFVISVFILLGGVAAFAILSAAVSWLW